MMMEGLLCIYLLILLGFFQVAQNKLARFLVGKCLLDKVPMKDIYKELKMPTVNQVNAQIKLTEVWKSFQSESYPLKWVSRNEATQDRRTRASNENMLCETYGGKIFNSTFINDSAKVWNMAPKNIKDSVSRYTAKKTIKDYILNLPL